MGGAFGGFLSFCPTLLLEVYFDIGLKVVSEIGSKWEGIPDFQPLD